MCIVPLQMGGASAPTWFLAVGEGMGQEILGEDGLLIRDVRLKVTVDD
jgi:hypothetical protein